VGVLGGGQLGLMLGLEGVGLGLELRFFDPSPEAPAARVGELLVADFGDQAALERFCEGLDVVTYEFESVPVAAARACERRVPVWPPPRALEVAQDRCSRSSSSIGSASRWRPTRRSTIAPRSRPRSRASGCPPC
jgi:5-(carboxyamino)imidazole ribonucleotide synthase